MLSIEGRSALWVNTVARGYLIGDDTADALSAAAGKTDK
jgi:hypothetical protein